MSDPEAPVPAPLPSTVPETAAADATGAPVDTGSLMKGIGLLLLLHLCQIPLALVAGWIWIGISQLVYVVPASLVLANKGLRRTNNGLWLGAGITFLLNGACFGILMLALSGADFH